MAVSNQKLILLTGATGFIGFQTLLDALKAGFRVRCAVRSEERGNVLLSKPALQSLQQDSHESPVEIVVVPDLAAPGAFNEAILGASYVIHAASPLRSTQPDGDLEAEFVGPAKRATLEILEAAANIASVERVVITSSVAALISPTAFTGLNPQDPDHPFTSSSRVPLMKPPFAHPSIAYMASKIASLELTETWAKETNPRFGIVNIHPSWVLGPAAWAGEESQVLLDTSNGLVLRTIVQGIKSPYPHMAGAVVDVRDVARLHIQSLQQTNIVEAGGCRSFIASTPGKWEDIPGIIRKNFVQELQTNSKRLTVLGEQTSIPLAIDSSDTELSFGWKFTDLEHMITDLISQYIELK
ncbi:uncharacterized protein N7500_005451 [Penicillium coprophilum]|uniref:uncharacterized protein n=1 Tax=Penicillium coprophilum TaxID=36646 RepID=UPI00239F7766|nr:uncharacterized protein N7500_005451 [Penicillium coprophilum]KAJ5163621.1 hypothetical protein N7500_005451 [Penicillium coprophilum]